MDEYVQEVLDLIEWANGPADSTWGSKRAEAGHPKPFGLKYLGVGNEDAITPVFRERFKMIHDAVRAKYPEIIIIGTTGWATEGYDFDEGWKLASELNLQMVDEHGYKPPVWFWENVGRFDKFDRQASQVYVGEYAAHDQGRANTLRSAIAEAAYLTGLERNGDLIRLASYAPLLAKQGHTQWRPDLIYFDNVSITPSINYYVQQLFSVNQGDVTLAAKLTVGEPESELALPTNDNGVYLGTWASQACFDDVRVMVGDKQMIDDAFENNADTWKGISGRWNWSDGAYCQTGRNEPALAHIPFQNETPEYTVSVRAKKTGGDEGFLVGFGIIDSDNYYWWNLGGWGNTQHAIERAVDGNRSVQEGVARGTIELNRWYTIKIHVTGERIRCYLDEQLIHDIAVRPAQRIPDLAASAVRDTATGNVIIKLVSKAKEPILTTLDLSALGVSITTATQTVLTGDPMAENRFGNDPEVLPHTTEIPASAQFQLTLPPSSFTVLRLH
jgi:alpha-L-arabinofuranosidase